MKSKILAFLKTHKILERVSAPRMALATVFGIFIALSPFLGLQTPLGIVGALILRVPITYVIAVIYGINNPFITMVPIILANYITGYFVFTYLIPSWDWVRHNPTWVAWLTNKIQPTVNRYLGLQDLYFWYFIIGGILFAGVLSIPWYPYFVKLFTRLKKTLDQTPNIHSRQP
jgi:uncharacterized protein (DUF2062 family)